MSRTEGSLIQKDEGKRWLFAPGLLFGLWRQGRSRENKALLPLLQTGRIRRLVRVLDKADADLGRAVPRLPRLVASLGHDVCPRVGQISQLGDKLIRTDELSSR